MIDLLQCWRTNVYIHLNAQSLQAASEHLDHNSDVNINEQLVDEFITVMILYFKTHCDSSEFRRIKLTVV